MPKTATIGKLGGRRHGAIERDNPRLKGAAEGLRQSWPSTRQRLGELIDVISH